MRYLITICVLFITQILGFTQEKNTISSDNQVTEVFNDVFISMPDYREMNSGSKLVVSYDTGCPAELQGAFEYAVKIWEEVIPMTLPINISVNIAPIRGRGTILSQVKFDTFNFNGETVDMFAAPMSMIKGIVLQEYHIGQQNRFANEIDDVSIFDNIDISITYNQNMLDQFDFSLDGEPGLDKYDFVTVALRDIAIGLGFTSSFTANTVEKRLIISGSRFTPFEKKIYSSLDTDDPYKAFENATKGSVKVSLYNRSHVNFDNFFIYAPNPWTNNASLRYLIPTDNPISKLLANDFGKGYVMRDMSGTNWNDIFYSALGWEKYWTVGAKPNSISEIGNTNDILPFKGQISLTFDEYDNYAFDKTQNINENILVREFTNNSTFNKSRSMSVQQYCNSFNCFHPSGPSMLGGMTLSVLMKNGKWDCIYNSITDGYVNKINVENLKLNYTDSEYARSISGGLRYRLSQCTQKSDKLYGPYYSYDVKYFTREFTPQKALIKYLNNIQTETTSIIKNSISDDWFIDVKVGLANLEGATKVIVEQLDEGEILPFEYEVEDFRKGYFIANLDRECSTDLTVICYNENGHKRSETITIPALGYSNSTTFSFRNLGDNIVLDKLPGNNISDNNLQYSIRGLYDIYGNEEKGIVTNSKIDISHLSKGIYALSIYMNSKQIGTHKFVKK